MSLFRGLSKASEMCSILKNRTALCKSFRSIEPTFSAKKIDLPTVPKKPPSAYVLFCMENRHALTDKDPTLRSTEIIKQLAVKWNELTLEKKSAYETIAREQTMTYAEQYKKFVENLTEEQKDELLKQKEQVKHARRLRKLKRALKESGIPKRPPAAYAIFIQTQSKDRKDIKPLEFFKEISEKWRKSSEEEKKIFEDQAQLAKKRYLSDMEKWKQKLISEGKENLLDYYIELKGKAKFLNIDENANEPLPLEDSKLKKRSKHTQ